MKALALVLVSMMPAAGEHRFTSGGLPIVYHVAGHGPVVVAHPGGPGAQWNILLMPEVERYATVITIEPVGTGASGRLADPNGYTMERYVADLEALRGHLGLETFVLLGHSHGGFVAQSYALAHPGRLRGLILYDTTPTTGPEWQRDVEANLKWFEHETWFADAKAALGEETSAATDDQMTAIFFREMPLYFADWSRRAREFEDYRRSIRFTAAPSKAVTDTTAPSEVGVAPVLELRSRLHEIKTPTLVISGAKDFVCSPKFAKILDEGIPGSKLVTLEHSGHMGHVEEPEAFAKAIKKFLAKLP